MSQAVYADASALAAGAADRFISLANAAISERGQANIALSGGSTPEALYKLLAAPDRVGKIEWQRMRLFLGDERLVPPDDPRSNYAMIKRTLLTAIRIPASNVFPIPTTWAGTECAERYESCLRSELPNGRFDVVLLGLGEDGHTASLFPGFPSLSVSDRWVVASPPGTLPPPVERITLTYPILNAARNVIFLVSGEKKATVLRAVRSEGANPTLYPAAGIHPTHGQLLWLVDKAAAGE